MLTATSADGTHVRAYDEGRGPAVLLVGPGMDDGRRAGRIAAILSTRYRVLRPHRRQYRLDLKNGSPCSIANEVDDVLAIVRTVGSPVVLYGHSSGGVVALEALAASPSSFAGAVICEPPALIAAPLAGEGGEVLRRARAAVAAGRLGRAMSTFTREVVGLPPWQAWSAGMITAGIPRYRRLIACQLDDLEAMEQLGVRLDVYTQVNVPTVLLGGGRSPADLLERLDALGRVMPRTEQVMLHKRDHGADLKAPKDVARVIETHADKVLGQRE